MSFNIMTAVTICSDFGAQENKVYHCFHGFPIYLPWSDGTGCHDLVFWMLSYKPAFSLSSFTFIKRLFSFSLLSARKVWWCHPHIWGYGYFPLQSWFQLVLHPVPYLSGIVHSFIPWNIYLFTISTSKSLLSPHWASAVLCIENIL